jgi:hypothetical protein
MRGSSHLSCILLLICLRALLHRAFNSQRGILVNERDNSGSGLINGQRRTKVYISKVYLVSIWSFCAHLKQCSEVSSKDLTVCENLVTIVLERCYRTVTSSKFFLQGHTVCCVEARCCL